MSINCTAVMRLGEMPMAAAHVLLKMARKVAFPETTEISTDKC